MDEKIYDKAHDIKVILDYCRESLKKVQDENLIMSIKFKNEHGYCAFSPQHFVHFSIDEQKIIEKLTKCIISVTLQTKIINLENELVAL